jgi:mono/diheme cytochrome c family protein
MPARRTGATGLAVIAILVGCRGAAPPTEPARWSEAWLAHEAARYLDHTADRRASLEASLVNPANVYSRQRLAGYGRETAGWDALPVWNPRSRPIDRAIADGLGRGRWPELPAERLWDGRRPTTQAEWIALGRRVFFEFPLRGEAAAEHPLIGALITKVDPEALGIEHTAAGELPGLVVFGDVDGETKVGITCALCHTAVRDGAVVVGAARRRFDLGRLRLAYFAETQIPLDPALAARMATWGPGRADVTEDDDEDPVAIPDLWGLRDERYLTQAGTIRHVGPAALAIRQETQLLHANGLRVRPPRELAWALAMFLYSIEPPPARPVAAADADAVRRGAAVFEAECRDCHTGAIHGGEAIPVARIGTDPSLADGRARGTGRYRVAPLVRVADAAPYFHDGSVPTLEQVLSPARTAPGHRFGTALPEADRAALVKFLETL